MGLDVTIDLREVRRAAEVFERFPAELHENLRGAMSESLLEVLKEAKDRVHVVTGTLRRSITATQPADAGTGWKGSVGTNLSYAAIEEFGFRGVENVRAYVRSVKSRNVRERGRIVAKGVAYVSAHTRQVNRKGHPYLGPALEAAKDRISQLHVQAVEKTIAERTS